ncbi:MAG: hypothetical protein EOO10_07720 [Chitinophagaceae bacterium]|nr:MAG: hypothetical protein EOO10_07720 [Chitinophagaceae bacterium]
MEPKIEFEFKKASAICLLMGSILSTATMALHPTGGDIDHILKVKNVLIFSHSLALFCLPLIGFGFSGLSNILQTKNKIASLAFFVAFFGLLAAMVAATLNGLVLPIFASRYWGGHNDISLVTKIMGYGHTINIAMTYIFITAISVAIAIWSFLIILNGHIQKWLGYFGLIVIAIGILGILLRFNFTDLFGFRTFMLGLVSWIVAVGTSMLIALRTDRNAIGAR